MAKYKGMLVAWINKRGTVMSNMEYEETKNDSEWGWIIEKHWIDATPLYTEDENMIKTIKELEKTDDR